METREIDRHQEILHTCIMAARLWADGLEQRSGSDDKQPRNMPRRLSTWWTIGKIKQVNNAACECGEQGWGCTRPKLCYLAHREGSWEAMADNSKDSQGWLCY